MERSSAGVCCRFYRLTGCGSSSTDVRRLFLPAVNEADSVMKVAEWQQTYYASDSGIQSGATTVQDDESSTEYSGRQKYAGPTDTSASAGGGVATAALESPTGRTPHTWQQCSQMYIIIYG